MTRQLLVALVVSLYCSGEAWACDCRRPPQPCQGLSATDVAFVGTVIRVDDTPSEEDDNGTPGEILYRFRVDEKILGNTGQEINVYAGRSWDDCNHRFQEGDQYVVVPVQGGDGRLRAPICGDTREIKYAQAVLLKLRAMQGNQRIPSVYGFLRSAEQPFGSPSVEFPGRPLTNTRVELRSEDGVLESKTDSNGVYAFYDVAAGEYQMTADLPAHEELAHEFLDEPLEPLKLPAGACHEYNVSSQATGRIRGRVLGPKGEPLSFADLDLFPAGKYPEGNFRWSEFQDQKKHKGFFEFYRVKPGDYILVFNDLDKIDPDTPFPRFYYPGVRDLAHAQRIHLEAGQQYLDADIRVSDGHPTRDLTVRLVAEEGKLPDSHHVEASGLDGSSPGEQELKLGVYTIPLFTDVRYTLYGKGYCRASSTESETEAVEVEGSDFDTKEITLIFKGKGCGEPPKALPK